MGYTNKSSDYRLKRLSHAQVGHYVTQDAGIPTDLGRSSCAYISSSGASEICKMMEHLLQSRRRKAVSDAGYGSSQKPAIRGGIPGSCEWPCKGLHVVKLLIGKDKELDRRLLQREMKCVEGE